MSDKGLRQKVDYGVLSAFYAELLTQRQLTTLALYCDEDLSLGEVARQQGVSRQAVNDTLQRAFERLDTLENSMGLHQRFEHMRQTIGGLKAVIDDVAAGRQSVHALYSVSRALEDYLGKEEAGNGI